MQYRFLSLLIVLLIVAGCSDKFPLSGTVTFSDNGEPLPYGGVIFESDTLVAQGRIQDGKYHVGTMKEKDGIPKGTYKVTVVGTDKSEQITRGTSGNESSTEVRYRQIHAKYEDSAQSGLTFTVDGTKKQYDIKVDRP